MHTDLIPTVTTIILYPIGGATAITTVWRPVRCIIGVGDEGSWGRGVSSKRRCSFGIGAVILVHLLFFIGVTEDDHVAITGWPKKTTVALTEQLPDDFLIP
jgi:hypothetical protein